jgi:predicted esterase
LGSFPSLALRWYFDRLKGVRVVLPQAPKQKSEWYGYNTPLWFQYKMGTSGNDLGDAVEASLDECAGRIVDVVKAEVAKIGDPGRVWLGGNSQGAPAAFHALMDKRMPRIGGFVASSGTIELCTKPDPAKRSTPIYFYTPGKDDVYPKTRTLKQIVEFRRSGFTHFKNIIVPETKHGSSKVAADSTTEFAAKMQEGICPLKARRERAKSEA